MRALYCFNLNNNISSDIVYIALPSFAQSKINKVYPGLLLNFISFNG